MSTMWMELIAAGWFFLSWFAYNYFVENPKYSTIITNMHRLRCLWGLQCLGRDNRSQDGRVLQGLQTNTAFFASTCLFIIAGLLTVLTMEDVVVDTLQTMPFTGERVGEFWKLKVLMMIVCFVYSFFRHTWALRHYNYGGVMMGTFPLVPSGRVHEGPFTAEEYRRAERFAVIMTYAGQHFTRGIKAYYYGLAMLAWFLGPWFLIIASSCTTYVLYRWEFKSNIVRALSLEDDGALD